MKRKILICCFIIGLVFIGACSTLKEKADELLDKNPKVTEKADELLGKTSDDTKTVKDQPTPISDLERLKNTPGVTVVEAKPEDPNNPTPTYDINEIEKKISTVPCPKLRAGYTEKLEFIKKINCPRLKNQQLHELNSSIDRYLDRING